MEATSGLLHEALILCGLISFPVLLTTMLVGVLISIVQAATQIQEQTLTMIPKLLVVAVYVVLFGQLAFTMLASLFNDALRAAPLLIRAA